MQIEEREEIKRTGMGDLAGKDEDNERDSFNGASDPISLHPCKALDDSEESSARPVMACVVDPGHKLV